MVDDKIAGLKQTLTDALDGFRTENGEAAKATTAEIGAAKVAAVAAAGEAAAKSK